MKTLFKILVLFFFALSFSSCSSDDNTEPISKPDPDPKPDPNPNPTTYVADVKSIIDTHCISCHKSPPINAAPMSLLTYTDVKNAENKNLSGRVSTTNINNVMPPNNRLPQTSIDIILQWEKDGFIEQ